MHLFTANEFTGDILDCDEGELEWSRISDLLQLPMWEGDKIFLDLLQTEEPFFSLKLVYEGETLREAWLNERKLSQ